MEKKSLGLKRKTTPKKAKIVEVSKPSESLLNHMLNRRMIINR